MPPELNLNAEIERKPSTIVAGKQSGVSWWGKMNPALQGPPTYFLAPTSEWDVVRIGNNLQALPGLARVTRCERRMKLHRKEKPASDFEDQTFLGWSVVEFDFTLTMWRAEQLAALQNWLGYIFRGAGDPPSQQSPVSVPIATSTVNLVNPTNAKARATQSGQQVQSGLVNVVKRPPIPVKAAHPALQLHGVDSIIFEKMAGPYQRSESSPDIFVVHFKTVQFKPSVPVVAKTQKKVNTLPTNLGEINGNGLGDLRVGAPYGGDQSGQAPEQGPASSGGAAPDDATSYSNLLRPLPGGQAGGATGGH